MQGGGSMRCVEGRLSSEQFDHRRGLPCGYNAADDGRLGDNN